jgi:WD40 repeat protein
MSDYPEKDKRRKIPPQRPTIIIIEVLIIVLVIILIGRNLFSTPQNTTTTVVVTPTQDANAVFKQAELHRNAEQWNEAIPLYTQALEAGYIPVSLAYFGRAYSEFELENYTIAIGDYTQAIATDPNCEYECPYHYYNRGLAYYRLEEYDQAIADLTSALELKPDYVNALRFRAEIHVELDNWERGLVDWKRVFEMQQTGKIERGLSSDGGAQTVLMDETGQQLQLEFAGKAGTLVTLRTTDSDFDPIVLLLTADGTPLAFDDDSGTGGNNARISNFELPADGDYQIWVAAYDVDDTGSVTLVMETGRLAIPDPEYPVITTENLTRLNEASQFARLDDARGAFSPDGRFFYEAAAGDGIVRYTLADAAPRYEQIVTQNDYYPVIAAGENDRFLAIAAGDDAILYDIIQNERLLVMYEAEMRMNDLAFSPDMALLAGASISNKIYLWDTVTGKPVFTLRSESSVINRLAFSPDGRWLALGSTDGTIEVWNVQTGKLATTWATGNDSEITALHFSPDGAVLAASDDGKNLWLWEAASGDLLHRSALNQLVLTLTFSPDNALLAVGTQQGEIRFLSLTDYNQIHHIEAHEKPVQNLLFTANGDTLYSAGSDNTVRVWRVSQK